MQAFEYVAPTRVDEVLQRLATAEADTILLGGGTSTVLMMKQDLLAPAAVIGLGRLAELRGITARPDGGLTLGATCTLTDLIRSPEVAAAYPVLARTAAQIGNVRVRNMATLGGNLVHADPAQDLPPVLMLLDATVTLQSQRGIRQVSLNDLYVDLMVTAVEPDELLTEIHLPPAPAGLYTTYVKFTPRSKEDYATVGVACALELEGNWCRRAGLVLGGVGATPLRMRAVEAALTGRPLTAAGIAAAATLVEGAVEPWDDLRGTAAYKQAMSRVWTERALLALGREAGLAL